MSFRSGGRGAEDEWSHSHSRSSPAMSTTVTSRRSPPHRKGRPAPYKTSPKPFRRLGQSVDNVDSFHWDSRGGKRIDGNIFVVPGYDSLYLVQFKAPMALLFEAGPSTCSM